MMAGIHHMEQVRFSDTQHFELQPQGRDAHPDPETSCTAHYDMSGDMEQDLQHIYNNYNALQEMVDIQSPVVLNPEVLMCGTNLHPEPQLTFSSDGIKIEYLDSYSGQDGGLITLLWEVSDIISIDCKWIQMVQSALMTLHVSSNVETVKSGPVKVEFFLADPQWEWKQQKIWQLDSRFQEVWKNIQSDDFASQNWSAEPSLCFPKQYFHGIGHFEDVIYPKGERDAVSISTRDVELLLPEIFVNDTIIDFYIKYLTQRIEPTERHRYHFFSSFFFRKLADLDKDQENAPKGREAFLGVRKWTRKIDVFAKEFLFIPVNFSLHWSLLVICYPGEVDTFKDGDARIADKLPCIMHMNSIKGTHTGLKDIIQSYLWEEWKERHPESASDSSEKFLNLRFLSLELPQQDNLFDCGLFLLHYVERFLTDAPRFFNPMKIDVFSSFLGDDWFVPAEASLKRSLIQKLIHELVTEPSKTYPKLVCGDEKQDKRHHRTENAMGEASRELIGQGCFAAEPDSVCGILGAHQQSKLICLNDSEKGLSVPGCTLETGGVSMVAQQEMQMCPSDDDIVVCSPSQDAKNEPFFAYSGNKLDPKSCAPEDAEEFKGSCSVVKDTNNHQESLLDILDSNQKISSHTEVEVHEHDIMVFECCPFSDNVNKVMAGQGSRNEVEYDRHEASQDMDPVMMLDASKHDTGTGQESTEGKAGNGRCDLSEDTDSFATGGMKTDAAEHYFERNIVKAMDDGCDISEDARSVMINNMNSGFAECLSERNTVEVVDPGAVEDDTKAEKTSTATGTINDNEQYVSSESKDGNSGSIMSSGSTVSCGLKEGSFAGDTTNGTSETHADHEDACHSLATCEVVPCEDDTTCTDVEMSHVKGISTCSTKDGTFSEKATYNARRPLLGSTSEDMIILVSDDMCSLKGVHCTEDGIIKGSTKEETSRISDKINDNKQYASSEFRDGNFNNAIAGENTQGSDVDGHELTAFPCEGDTDAEMPPHVDGTCSAEYENNSISDSVCEATKMQVSDEFGSTSEDDIIEGSTKEATSTIADKNNDSTQYASSANTDNAIAGESTHATDANGHELAAFPCEGGTDVDMPPHVKGITTCSAKDGTYSESGTSNAQRPLLGSTSEDKSVLVSDDMCLPKGVQCTEDGIIKGSRNEETSAISDKINDSTQYPSSEFGNGNTSSAIAGESTQVANADGHELAAFPCEGGTDAEMPPHVDGTCSAEDENNSISVCEAKKMQVSEEFRSTSEDDIIEGSTKEEIDTAVDKMNGSEQYALYESKDAGESTHGTDADGHEFAEFPCEGSTDAEMPPLVEGITTCSAKNGPYSEKETSNAQRPLLGSTCEDKSMLVSDDICSLKGVQCTEDGIIKGSTNEETSTVSDKINDSTHYASSELGNGNTDNAIAGESTQVADAVVHELAAFPCAGGTDAEMPPHVDGTCSAEDENNSISDSVCEAKKMQVFEEFRSSSEDIIEGSTKVETGTAADKMNGSDQYALPESKDAGESTHGTDADGHEFAAFPCEGNTDAEMPPHVKGITTCSAKDGTYSQKATSNAQRPLLGSTSEDGIIKGSTNEETSTISDKINDNTHYASSEFGNGNTDNAIAGESARVGDADGHELAAFPCEDGTDAEMPPHVDGTCSAEDENNSISVSVCEAKKMQVSEELRSSPEDDIIEGSTKEETDTVADKMNGSDQYASYESEDGNTNRPGSGSKQHDVSSEVKNGKCCVGAKRPFPDSSSCGVKKMQIFEDFRPTSEDVIIEGSTKEETDTAADKMNGREQYASYESEDGNTNGAGNGSEQHDILSKAKNEICSVGAKRPFADSSICGAKEMMTFDDKFWQERSERSEARFGRRYKRRIVWKRRKVISWTPPSSSESLDSD